MRYRKLRIAWCIGGLAVVLLTAFWVWNCSYSFAIYKRSPTKMVGLTSYCGGLTAFRVTWEGKWIGKQEADGWHFHTTHEVKRPSFLLFLLPSVDRQYILIPTWCLIVLSIAVAVVPIHWRFSLRTLLIATTLIAVVLDLIVWMSRTG
jgi:hypothetical protein